MSKVCIFGAGAIGGLIGAKLALKGEAEVSLVARGPHLQAMKVNGLTLKQAGEIHVVHPKLTDTPAELGPQDYIILTLKAHGMAGVIGQMAPLMGPDTAILFAQNGIPWWYFHGVKGPLAGTRLQSVDPGGRIWDGIGPERALGAVVWQAAEVESPGVVVHNFGDRMPIGEPTGEKSDRAAVLSRLLTSAGIKSPVRPELRNEIWLKLWGNLSFNPVSVLTGGMLDDLASDPGTRRVIGAMMSEAQAMAEALGITFPVSAEERMDMAARVGAHRTSMLQDVEAGRPTELDALLGVVLELAGLVKIGTPSLQLVYDLCKFRCERA